MVGTVWIYRLGKSLYYLKSPQFSHCDLVVPLGYGLLNQHELPDAAKKTLQASIQIASEYQAPMAWASANYFWSGCEHEENRLKMAEVHNAALATMPMPIIAEGVTNSVTEARNIRGAMIKAGIETRFQTIVVIADWPHARSTRKIWQQVFPESAVKIISIDAKWGEAHPAFFQRSEMRWLLINLIRHLALIILGTKKVSRFKQPIKK